jgi:predicted NBD/HSP70 family sugar kinase
MGDLMMLGLELRDRLAVAVALDAAGGVLARAEVAASPDPAAAAREALDAVAGASDRSTAVVGIAALAPEGPDCRLVRQALGSSYFGPFPQPAAIQSGTASAIAEAWTGAATGVRDVVFFGAADHTTAGIVRSGVPWVGAHGRAAAVAWFALNPVEREDYRRAGCLEAEVGASGIVRRLVWRIKAGDRSRVQDMVNGELAAITVEHVLDAARGQDGVSISVMRDTAKYLGMAAANLVAVADPDVLVLGGVMASAADLLLEPTRAELTRRLPPAMAQALIVVRATLGEDAAAIGAARAAAVGLL